jgi:dTDP-4-dehydrorhamnose reductase
MYNLERPTILLFGKYGQLGWELNRTLQTLGNVTAFDYPDIDLSNPVCIKPIIEEIRPHVILNATAYTAVDKAETEPEIAMAVNAEAPGIMAEYAKKIDAAFIHFSTDYVFDGRKGSPYKEIDEPNPLSVYAHSKFKGEQAVAQIGGAYLIFRTSWVYSMRGDNFVTKVLRWSREKEELKIVDDQIGNPTWARMLAEITAQLLVKGNYDISSWVKEKKGIYHLAGYGITSRHEWVKAILNFDPHKEEQRNRQVFPTKTSDFPTPAQRPLYSALMCNFFNRTFGLSLPEWQEALKLALGYQE